MCPMALEKSVGEAGAGSSQQEEASSSSSEPWPEQVSGPRRSGLGKWHVASGPQALDTQSAGQALAR